MSEKTEKEIQKNLEELTSLRASIEDLVSKYNEIAKSIDHEERLAFMSACVDIEDFEYEDRPKNIEQYVCDNYEHIPVDIYRPNADGWFPSSFCIYY